MIYAITTGRNSFMMLHANTFLQMGCSPCLTRGHAIPLAAGGPPRRGTDGRDKWNPRNAAEPDVLWGRGIQVLFFDISESAAQKAV